MGQIIGNAAVTYHRERASTMFPSDPIEQAAAIICSYMTYSFGADSKEQIDFRLSMWADLSDADARGCDDGREWMVRGRDYYRNLVRAVLAAAGR